MKGALFLFCGLVGGLAGALLVRALDDDHGASTPQRAAREAPDGLTPADRVEIRAMIRESMRGDGAAAPRPDVRAERPGKELPEPEGPDGGGPAGPARDVAELVAPFTGGVRPTGESYGALWTWMSRPAHHKRVPELVAALQEKVEQDPKNADMHVALATAFVGELNYNTPPGARQGLVWAKAVRSYDAAIAIEPQHWSARYGKAFGTTFIPEQFGQRPNAIKQFEELRKIQERRAPEPHFVQTYQQLGRLYKDEGNVEQARKIWEEGLKLFPDDPALREQLDVSTKK